MARYEIYSNAGQVPYSEWQASGIRIPVFDKDGTFTSFRGQNLIDEVVEGLNDQRFSDIFPRVAVCSNSKVVEETEAFSASLASALGLEEVYSICKAKGYNGKPALDMGLAVSRYFNVKNAELGVVGDRRLTDVSFGLNLGVGKIALCHKVGEGDDDWVPSLRILEAGITRVELIIGRASTGHSSANR